MAEVSGDRRTHVSPMSRLMTMVVRAGQNTNRPTGRVSCSLALGGRL